MGLVASVASARANGRPPATVQISTRSGDPSSLYISSTFGLLISHDGGCTVTWTCEESIGYGGIYDPTYAIASDGTIFATTPDGLRISRDDGCTFDTVTTPDGPAPAGAVAIGSTGEVWYATASYTSTNAIYRSVDGGVTFSATSGSQTSIAWTSMSVAPGDAGRVYAIGRDINIGNWVFATMDGTGWTVSAFTDLPPDSPTNPRIVAIDPLDALTIYISVDSASGGHLLRSRDGGVSMAALLQTTTSIHGVVIAASSVFVGSETTTYRSTDDGATFIPLPNAPKRLGCLTYQGDALIGCAANWDPDFMAITRSTDLGQTWTPVWRFAQLAGPHQCDASTPSAAICNTLWPTLRAQFGASGPTCGDNIWGGDPATPPLDKGCCDASGTPTTSITLVVLLAIFRRRQSLRDQPPSHRTRLE